jgi:hypothetical protein
VIIPSFAGDAFHHAVTRAGATPSSPTPIPPRSPVAGGRGPPADAAHPRHHRPPRAAQTGQPYLRFPAASLVGACLGFLPYNFRRGGATIFLGDHGASFIGFTPAGLAVMGEWAKKDPLVALVTPTLTLAVPLFDIAFVSVARPARYGPCPSGSRTRGKTTSTTGLKPWG